MVTHIAEEARGPYFQSVDGSVVYHVVQLRSDKDIKNQSLILTQKHHSKMSLYAGLETAKALKLH